ncbi:MAG: TolC family protein [Bryobacteraceae bacterium]
MRRLLSATLFGALCAGAQPLLVEEVVDSIRRHHPLLLAALGERDIAENDILAAQGKFDTTIRSRFDSDSFGYYSNRRLDTWVEQPLAWQGASVYSGYRLGEGTFAPYDGKLDTRSLGEWRSGIKLPLLRDREIDSRRGELARARIGRSLADYSVDQQRLILLQAGIARYWNWVAAGRRLAVTRDVLAIAEARQKLLEEGVREGQLPAIDAVDNRRAILQRQSALIDSERVFQQTGIELSLYLRDASGQSMIAGPDRVPPAFPQTEPVTDSLLTAGLAQALARRPEVGRLRAQIDQLGIDVSLARNAAKPAVDVLAGFTSDRGTDPAVRRGPEELKAGIAFEFPFQNRSARGKEGAALAKRRQLEQREAYLKDQIAAEVRDAVSAVRAAHDKVRVLGDEVRVSRELEDAERARFDLGEGTLFILNLREQATLDASIRLALAAAEYQRSLAGYSYSTGQLLDR